MSRTTRVFLTIGLLSGFVFGSPRAKAGVALEPPVLAPPPHDILKNRYISIDPRGELGTNPSSHHIRLLLDSTQVPKVEGFGPWWANAPDERCISIVTATQPVTEPDWSGCPTLHLTGCPIIPTSTYAIATIVGEDDSGDLLANTQAKPNAKWHGDCVGFFTGTEWTPPDGNVNANDFVAAIKTFQNPANMPGCGTPPCNATHVSVTDLAPNGLGYGQINKIVNISDVFAIILGFQGKPYPGPFIVECP